MKSIFLSVITKIPDEYREGYDNFLNLLALQNLNQRTLGTTDFATRTPLDEVVELMYQCEGAIILGFPQIHVIEGKVSGSSITVPVQLASEWNHIECSIACAIGLPILVIYDSHISRGIFDTGVLNTFLYRKDLKDRSWSTSKEITGAISKWQKTLMPIIRPKVKKKGGEEPTPLWGCFTFPPDEKLYCPYCYNNEGEKFLATRVNIKNYMCTSCKSLIPTG